MAPDSVCGQIYKLSAVSCQIASCTYARLCLWMSLSIICLYNFLLEYALFVAFDDIWTIVNTCIGHGAQELVT